MDWFDRVRSNCLTISPKNRIEEDKREIFVLTDLFLFSLVFVSLSSGCSLYIASEHTQ